MFIDYFSVPQGTEDAFSSRSTDFAAQPFGHRQLLAKLEVVHHPALLYFYHSLLQYRAIRQYHLMAPHLLISAIS